MSDDGAKSRVLVTGGTGFLGSHLVRSLLERGHQVVLLSRGPLAEQPGVTVVRGDITYWPSVERAATGCSAVFHCAGKVSRDRRDAAELRSIHVEGTQIVLGAAKRVGVRRAIVASTSGTVAITDDPADIRDETAPAPTEIIARFPYYRSKLYAEMAALEMNAPGTFEVVVVNPTLLLGPGDARGSSTGDVVDFIEGRVPFTPGGGLSFVDVRDAAEALILANERGRAGERYLVAAQNLTIAAFFQRLQRLTGVRAPALHAPRSRILGWLGVAIDKRIAERLATAPRLDEVSTEMAQYFWYVDSTKARTELGWAPRDPMETLSDTVEDLRARGVVWPAKGTGSSAAPFPTGG